VKPLDPASVKFGALKVRREYLGAPSARGSDHVRMSRRFTSGYLRCAAPRLIVAPLRG